MRAGRLLHAMLAGLLLTAGPAAAQTAASACPGDVTQAATREQTEYQSADRTVRGLLYRPRHPNGAAIVLLHGARGLLNDAATLDSHAIQLASRGYLVLVPNYYDARAPRAARTASEVRAWRRAALDGARHVGGLEGVDPSRTGLWGYSLGGYLAADAAVDPSSTVRAAVGLAAGTDAWAAGRGRRRMPVLLIRARRDPVISPASTEELASSLRGRGATVEIQTLDWEGHGYDAATWCDIFRRSTAFFDATLIG